MLRVAEIWEQPIKHVADLRHKFRERVLSSARARRHALYLLLITTLFLVTSPLFFDIYRLAAFNTSPRDDYAPQLLAFAGETGELPLRQPKLFAGAPFGYRLLSVAIALPFYYLLPLYQFTNSPISDAQYLRATQALSLVSYLSIVLASFFNFLTAYRRFHASLLASIIVSALSISLSGFISRTGVDPFAILLVSALVYYMRKTIIFYGLIMISALANEKVLIIIGSLLLGRIVFSLWSYRHRFMSFPSEPITALRDWARLNRRILVLLSSASVSALLYLLMRVILHLGGDAHRTDVSLWLPKAISTLSDTISLKGAVTNLIPIGILIVIATISLISWQSGGKTQDYFQPSDLICFVVLLVLALIINSKFTAGRLVMHCFPIYLPLVARFIDKNVASTINTQISK